MYLSVTEFLSFQWFIVISALIILVPRVSTFDKWGPFVPASVSLRPPPRTLASTLLLCVAEEDVLGWSGAFPVPPLESFISHFFQRGMVLAAEIWVSGCSLPPECFCFMALSQKYINACTHLGTQTYRCAHTNACACIRKNTNPYAWILTWWAHPTPPVPVRPLRVPAGPALSHFPCAPFSTVWAPDPNIIVLLTHLLSSVTHLK